MSGTRYQGPGSGDDRPFASPRPPAPALKTGFYFPRPPGIGEVEALERRTGVRVDIVHLFQAWGADDNRFPEETARLAADTGRRLMITWEPWVTPDGLADPARFIDQPGYGLKEIAGGAHDAYISAWARAARAARDAGARIMLRPMHEMNGDWYPWCGTVNGNQPGGYARAWRHMREVFGSEGASGVDWVWSPYCISVPDTPGNEMGAYFPGDDSVDIAALDGYNWGNARPWSAWQGFEGLFGGPLARLRELSRGPVMVAEAGCAQEGGDKAAWFKAAADALSGSLSFVEAVVWFSINKECDWRVDSSARSLTAFREAFGGRG